LDGSVDIAIKYLDGLSSLVSAALALQAGEHVPTPVAGPMWTKPTSWVHGDCETSVPGTQG